MSIVESLRSKFGNTPHTPTPWVMEEQWSGMALKPADGACHTICKIHGTTGDYSKELVRMNAALALARGEQS